MNFLINLNNDQNILYVVLRSTILFFITLTLLRYGNRRFQLNTAFDFLLLIAIGNVMSQGINGSASLVSTLVGIGILIVLHRCIAVLTFYFPSWESFFKGKPHLIIKGGKILKDQLKKYHLTEADILLELREQLQIKEVHLIALAYLESTGKLSFILKKRDSL